MSTENPVVAAARERCEELATRVAELRATVEAAQAEIDAAENELQVLRETERLLSGLSDRSLPDGRVEPNDEGAGDSSQPPAPELPPEPEDSPPAEELPASQRKEAVYDAIRGGAESSGQIRDELHDAISPDALRGLLHQLVDEGRIIRSGAARGTRYRVAEVDAPVTPPAKRDRPSNGQPTLEGRVLSLLTLRPLSVHAAALELEVSVNELRPVIGKLMREGDVRTRREGNETVYVGQP